MNTQKTKLTLTVRQDVINEAKRRAKEQGVSISRLFEKAIEEKVEEERIKKEKKSKIEAFLKHYEKQKPVQALPQSDKELWHQHLEEKYG